MQVFQTAHDILNFNSQKKPDKITMNHTIEIALKKSATETINWFVSTLSISKPSR